MHLSEAEADGIVEAFNMGIGTASASLSEMIGQEILLGVPSVELLSYAEAIDAYREFAEIRVSGVREHFSGPLSGRALLLFPESRSLELVRMLLKQDVGLDFLTEMEEEALTEVGNIILNACLSSLAEIMGDEIINEIPVPIRGLIADLLTNPNAASQDDLVMKLRIDFSVKNVDISGHIVFLMDIESLDKFRQNILAYFRIPFA